ncbi:uncharacterized protein LOC124778023 [Schistocerca piceifrons]|uniref:uncharacterized protein LOC124778023 n=1 Tax=Schistocerca piceifrons TaxID=274613 RepID=UPI001F5FEC46|nr:uncharacterized protein LOC124778023 [Schistocerca piceifrons]
MAPALSLDDAAEVLGKNELDLLLAYTYNSTWGKDSKEAARCIPKKPVLNTTYETNADQVRYQPEKTDTVECPPYKALQVKVPTEKPEELYSEQRGTEGQSDITTENCELRIAHDLPKSGYSGYMPRHVANIPLCKPKYSVTDVRVSVSQAVTMRTGSKEIC